jgi:signal transduction histidine kinase
MFRTARLKLTGWYLLIIMAVSIAFSGVIYRAASNELSRFAEAQRNKFERRLISPNIDEFRLNPPPFIDNELLEETKKRITTALILINLGILGIASVLGYYLSGKTLAPIKEMVDEQYRFISDASHELKTPLTALRTSMEVTLRDKTLENKEARSIIKDNLHDVVRLQKLTEGLLELSKSETLPLQPCSLVEILNKSVAEVQPLADERMISIKNVASIKPIILAEPATFGRAIVTILDNAIKYSKEKSEIKTLILLTQKEVRLSIVDKGIGIDKNDLVKVTDRFYRSDRARSSNGYGLGLSIAKNIVELHNGKIQIASKIGRGTTVTISLPYSARIQKAKT